MMKRLICVLTMLCVMMTGFCALAEAGTAAQGTANGDVLYQVALLQSLVQGY